MYQCHNAHDIFFCYQFCRVTLCYETRIFWKNWAGKCLASSGARSQIFFTLTPLLLWLNVLRLPNICRFCTHSESNLNNKFNAIHFSNNVQRMTPASALREKINSCSHSYLGISFKPRLESIPTLRLLCSTQLRTSFTLVDFKSVLPLPIF